MTENGRQIGLWQRLLFGSFAGVFTWAAYLQLNDGMAMLWVGIYAVAAVASGMAALGIPWSRRASAGAFLIVLAGAAYLAVQIFVFGAGTTMSGVQTAGDPSLVELKEGREMFGLLIIAVSFALQFRATNVE